MGQKDLPLASGEEHKRAFGRVGWEHVRTTGSHLILAKQGEEPTLSIPNHKEVKRALLQKQIKLAGLSEAEYLDCFYGKKRRAG